MTMQSLTLDLRVHPLDDVKRAAYRFGGTCFVSVRLDEPGENAIVELRPRDLAVTPLGPTLLREFELAVFDEGLRAAIARQTEPVRNLILAAAFSQTSLLDVEGEEGDINEDPLGILDDVAGGVGAKRET